jgi:predicted metalloprotease with PDZ domain
MIILTAGSVKASPKITYSLSFEEAQAHYIDVEMSVDNIENKTVELHLPVWTPGSYLVREFSKSIEGFKAFDKSGKELKTEKTRKNIWKIYNDKSSDFKVKYRVYAFELTVRTCFVDVSHAYLNGSNIFMYINGMQELPSEIKIRPYKGWKKVSTSLENKSGDPFTLSSPNYDILADSPIEIGDHDVIDFTAQGIKHSVAMVGGGNYDKEKIVKDFTKIIDEETKVFGKNPCKNYTFIVHNVASGGGGLEHLNSTTVQALRFSYTTESSYNGFLGLIAHEYFHLWNVKRLRPVALGPFDYDNENYTRALWIAEGFTAFYDNLFVRRAGFYTPEKYLELVANEVSLVENSPGNKIQPLSESSFDAWIKYYRRNENSVNSTISYYDKGSIVGCMLNLEILHQTKGKQSLDDVLKYMYEEYYEKQKRGFTDEEMKAALEKIAGISLDEFYSKYINGTETIDYIKYFNYAGLKLTDHNATKNEAILGANTNTTNGKVLVTSVIAGTPAYQYGINVNDEIIAIDNIRADDAAKIIAMKKPGDKINVLVTRDGMIRTIEVVLDKNKNVKYALQKIEKPTEEQEAVYKAWIR